MPAERTADRVGRPDVLVVGGGPAGSTTAGLLARMGWNVVVIDRARFPRPKPCGECVNPGGVAALERLGLLEPVRRLGPASLRGWRIRTFHSPAAVGSFAPRARAGLAVAREKLDGTLLAEARRRGARVVEGVKAEGVRPGGRAGTPAVRIRGPGGDPRTVTARVVVGADGLRSVTARSLAAHRRRPRLRKLSLTVRVRGRGPDRERGQLVLGSDRVVGLAPVHARRDLWNATVVVRSEGSGRRVAGRPGDFVRSALAEAPVCWSVGPDVVEGPWASGPFDWPVRRRSAPGVVLVGDAAGYYDPLTGQGIYRALRSAELAAATIDRTLRRGRVSWHAFREYDRTLGREFRRGRWLQRAIELVVSRAALREPIVTRLAEAPESLSALIRVTGDAAPGRSLLAPPVWWAFLKGHRSPS